MKCAIHMMEHPDDLKLHSQDCITHIRRDPTIESLTDSCLTVIGRDLSIDQSLGELNFSDESDRDSDCSAISYENSTLTSAPRLPVEQRELLPTPSELVYSSSHDDDDDDDDCSSFTSYTSGSQTSDGLYNSSVDEKPELVDEWSDADIPSYACSSPGFSHPEREHPANKSTTLGSEDSGFDERQQELWRHLNSCPHLESVCGQQIATHIAPTSIPCTSKSSSSISDFISR